MRRALTFTTLLALGSCAASAPQLQTLTVTKVVYVPWLWPSTLETCAPDPNPLLVPRIAATDPHAGSQVAHYIVQLREHDAKAQAAADDCRAVLGAAINANLGSNQEVATAPKKD
jgi:hypothetical protein